MQNAPYEFQGTVTQKSNGSIVITPKQDSKRLPAMGDEVTISIEVTQPVEPPPPVMDASAVKQAARKERAAAVSAATEAAP